MTSHYRDKSMQDQSLSISDFKTRCLDLLKQVGEGRIGTLTVTRHGKPVAVVTAPPSQVDEARSVFGAMRGKVHIPASVDLTDPVYEGDSVAGRGLLHL
jgi:prevent-host-death family protein